MSVANSEMTRPRLMVAAMPAPLQGKRGPQAPGPFRDPGAFGSTILLILLWSLDSESPEAPVCL